MENQINNTKNTIEFLYFSIAELKEKIKKINIILLLLLLVLLYPILETEFIKEITSTLRVIKRFIEYPTYTLLIICWLVSIYSILLTLSGRYSPKLNIDNLTVKKIFSPSFKKRKEQNRANEILSETSGSEISELLKERYYTLDFEYKLRLKRIRVSIVLIIVFIILLLNVVDSEWMHIYFKNGHFLHKHRLSSY